MKKLKNIFRKLTFYNLFINYPDRLISKLQTKRNFRGTCSFVDRKKDSRNLLIVVAGYKPNYWEIVFPRIYQNTKNYGNIDVCICVPGHEKVDDISGIAERYKWSVLSTKKNRLSLAQNLAIRKHPNAENIIKMDEDIVIGDLFLYQIIKSYHAVKGDGVYNPGIVVPVVNVNGSTYVEFLKTLNCLQEYEEKFGEKIVGCMGMKAHYSGEAGKFLWEKSLPFDKICETFSKEKFAYVGIPVRYSIGCFLIDRKFWKSINGFRVGSEGQLGLEEKILCEECMDKGRPIVMIKNIFVGHLGFRPQKEILEKFHRKRKPDLLLSKTNTHKPDVGMINGYSEKA